MFSNGEFFMGRFDKGDSIDGVYHYKNGNTYVGQFRDYKKHGFGKMQYEQNKASYEG